MYSVESLLFAICASDIWLVGELYTSCYIYICSKLSMFKSMFMVAYFIIIIQGDPSLRSPDHNSSVFIAPRLYVVCCAASAALLPPRCCYCHSRHTCDWDIRITNGRNITLVCTPTTNTAVREDGEEDGIGTARANSMALPFCTDTLLPLVLQGGLSLLWTP